MQGILYVCGTSIITESGKGCWSGWGLCEGGLRVEVVLKYEIFQNILICCEVRAAKLSTDFIKYREMKTYEEVALNLQAFLDSRLPRRCG